MAERDVPDTGPGRRERAGRTVDRIGVTVFLAAVWVMLWGQLTWLTVLGGLVLGALLTVVVRQPPTPLGLGPRVGGLVVALGWVGLDIARSTVRVAWAAVRTGPATRAELVRITTPVCRSDVLVVTAGLISISPGTMVVEIDTQRSELLVHVLPVGDLERDRREVERMAHRLVNALQPGSIS
ncbi:MAG TPA: Na+/H+ antiporter subunit E [Pseudonocardia sp.]|nr:Na+/H+ antiporter subunit E [Pseudonocardia sp.]